MPPFPSSTVCQGAPAAVANVNWAACTDSTGINVRCAGLCTSGSGTPSVMCASVFGAEPAWDMSTLQGACRTGGCECFRLPGADCWTAYLPLVDPLPVFPLLCLQPAPRRSLA
jgi:hypothetical protein